MTDDLHIITITSGVSQRTGEGFVDYCWGEQRCQFTAVEARAHAQILLEAAEAAIMDAAVLQFLMQQLGVGQEKAAEFVGALRHFRLDMKAAGNVQ